ncbi:arsinothricin resistance N-acetyltransferase ArsN1 family B [Halomarina rubra]|uniref:Arsinothricin resistance N-acetyltransferase ArsN1 family B n=1 Tax=Halomarina rubra TaxID=2071873 RepID=A0ABD6ATV6_9EURY|nr:arsinothricin resistance N-acetyltransferase ArsN1 family B [Halomarina rubra]
MPPRSIRLASPTDATAIQRIYEPYVAETAVSFERDPPSVTEMADHIDATLPDHPWLVAEVDGEVVGYAYAGPFRSRPAYRWAVECSVYVAPDAHRCGVGRVLYGALFALLDQQGYRTAYAGMTVPNEASAGLHEALGFTPVGTFEHAGYKQDAWHDVQWWQRPVGETPADADDPPAEPRPLSDLDEDALSVSLAVDAVDAVDGSAGEEE